MQKGVDLIADVFPQILEDDIHVQLYVGPDLYITVFILTNKDYHWTCH